VAIAFNRGSPGTDLTDISAGQQRLAIIRPQPGQSAMPVGPDTVAAGGSAPVTAPEGRPRTGMQPPKTRITSTALEIPDTGNTEFNAALIKASFASFDAHAPNAMEYFYAHLFSEHPEIRSLFPLTMSDHRRHVYAALAQLITVADRPAQFTDRAARLGRVHRKYGVKDQHYPAFFDALLATVAHFSGPRWTARAQAEVGAAFAAAAAAMRAGAAADADRQPAWWTGEIIGHELRAADLAVLRIQPDNPFPYRAGQYLPVQVPRWPRVWRHYSLATAPRPGQPLELHVRAVSGGTVSSALVHHAQPGDTVLLGAAEGTMTAPGARGRDLVCVAGGTGLAPIKAIIEQVIIDAGGASGGPGVTLFVGAKTAAGLYDLPALEALAGRYLPLTVFPVLSRQPGWDGLTGLLPAVVRQRAACTGKEIYVCGPDSMVRETRRLLAHRSPARFIHHDPLTPLPDRHSWT
jgi:NAD(P)H-flavin reductase/hemoglobin-like flavoprotein